MNVSGIFRSKFCFTYCDKDAEKEFKTNRLQEFRSNNLIFMLVGIVVGVASIVWPTIKFDLVAQTMANFHYLLSCYISLGLLFIFTILILIFKNNYIIHLLAVYFNYFALSIHFGYLRYFFLNTVQIDQLVYYALMIAEFCLRNCFFTVGILEFSEGFLLSLLILAYIWGLYPIKSVGIPTLYVRTSIYTTVILCSIVMAYFATRQIRTSFFYRYQLTKGKKWCESIIENMNTGFMHIQNGKITHINRTMITKVMSISYLSSKINARSSFESANRNGDSEANINIKADSVDIETVKQNSDEILQFLLSNINKETIQSVSEEWTSALGTCESIFNSFKQKIDENPKSEEFTLMGVKTIGSLGKSETDYSTDYSVLEVYCRYYSNNNIDEFEFIFNDITRTKITEEKNADFKYKTLFLSKVAHEFKNPLICITELVDQITDQEGYSTSFKRNNSRDKEYLQIFGKLPTIKSLSNYLLILIKDFDYFSASQIKKKINREFADTKLDDLLSFCKEVTVALLDKSNRSDSVKFKINIGQDVPKVIWTDEFKLKQILINLISNSIKFTNRGKIDLNINRVRDKLEFRVKDTGIGFSEDRKKNMFSLFSKGLQSSNKIGTGLGLTIVRDLVKLLGSEIQFLSEFEKGTEFWFCLNMGNTALARSKTINHGHTGRLNNTGNLLDPVKTPNKSPLPSLSLTPLLVSRPFEEKISLQKTTHDDSTDTVFVENLELSFPMAGDRQSTSRLKSEIKPIPKRKNFTSTISQVFSSSTSQNSAELNIIVADDEALTRQSAIRMITKSAKARNIKLKIIEAEDGIEVLGHVFNSLYSEQNIHAIISDETMNFMKGTESANILHRLCTFKQWTPIPFYILTAYEDPKTIQSILGNKVTSVFTKPLRNTTADTLLSNIAKSITG